MKSKITSLIKLATFIIFLLLLILPVNGQSLLNGENLNINQNPNFKIDLEPPVISNVAYYPSQPDETDQIIINCTVTDVESGVSEVRLYYRQIGESIFNMTVMTDLMTNDIYEIEIGPYEIGFQVEFYIWAEDNQGNFAENDNAGEYYSFTVISSDKEAPLVSSIMHTPANANDANEVQFRCIATDLSGIKSVELSYRVNGGSWTIEEMVEIESSTYAYNVTPFSYQDFVEYKINATDNSYNNNSQVYDNDGQYYHFTVLKFDSTPPQISNIQISPSEPYSGIVINITCSITDQYNEIELARLYYRINEGDWLNVDFTHVAENIYQAQIGPFEKDDLIEFYIYAKDSFISNINEIIDDNSGDYYSFTVLKNTLTSNLFVLLPILVVASLSILYRRRK